jgi:hypothetical protein
VLKIRPSNFRGFSFKVMRELVAASALTVIRQRRIYYSLAILLPSSMHTVIETPTFLTGCRHAGLSEDDLAEIVRAISSDPLAGDLIPGAGGARTRRFAGRGKGKSGGYRTVSYFAGDDVPVVLLALIDKGERANLSPGERAEMKKGLAGYASDYRASVRRRVVMLGKRSRP